MKKATMMHPKLLEQLRTLLFKLLTARANYYHKQHQEFKE